MQNGEIRRVGKCWLLRFYEPVLENGKVINKRRAKKLATYSDQYRTEASVRPLAAAILGPINARSAQPQSEERVVDFLEFVYLPHCRETLRPSTAAAYDVIFRLVKPHLGDLRLKETRTSDIDRVMKSVADTKARAHTVHRNMKSFLSGAFRYAIRADRIFTNPVRDSAIPRGKPMQDTPAYTLDEIHEILALLPQPIKTVVLVAALTGLRISEIKGLRWEDFDGDQLNVQRGVWNGHVNDTKTLSSKSPVPVLSILKTALEEHRKRTPGNGWIFQGATGNPLRVENYVRLTIMPRLKKAGLEWKGWHAFRRGLATNLHDLGAEDKTIQAILRHSTVAVTQNLYIKPVAAKSRKEMRKLEKAFARSAARAK